VEEFGDLAPVAQELVVLPFEAVQILSLEVGYLVQSQQRKSVQVGSRLQTVEGPLPQLSASPLPKQFEYAPEHFRRGQTHSLYSSQ
jgi:hypothetical protein